MAISLVSAAFRQELSPPLKLVLLALADSANEDDGGCWFLVETLSRKTGYGQRALFLHFKALEKAGYLRRERRFGRSSVYWLSLDRLGMGAESHPAKIAGLAAGDPAKIAGHPAKIAGHPAKIAGHPAKIAPISVSYPSSYPLTNPPEAGRAKNALPGSRTPESGTRSPEGLAQGSAYALGAPNGTGNGPGGRGSRLHVSSGPDTVPEVSEEQRALNRARLHALALSLKGIPG